MRQTETVTDTHIETDKFTGKGRLVSTQMHLADIMLAMSRNNWIKQHNWIKQLESKGIEDWTFIYIQS